MGDTNTNDNSRHTAAAAVKHAIGDANALHPLGFLLQDGRSLALDDPGSQNVNLNEIHSSDNGVDIANIKEKKPNLIVFNANEEEEDNHVEEIINLHLDTTTGNAALIIEKPSNAQRTASNSNKKLPNFITGLADRMQPPTYDHDDEISSSLKDDNATDKDNDDDGGARRAGGGEHSLIEKGEEKEGGENQKVLTGGGGVATEMENQVAQLPKENQLYKKPLPFPPSNARGRGVVDEVEERAAEQKIGQETSRQTPPNPNLHTEREEVQENNNIKDRPAPSFYPKPLPSHIDSHELVDGYNVRDDLDLYNIANPARIKRIDIVNKEQKIKPRVDWQEGTSQPYPLTSAFAAAPFVPPSPPPPTRTVKDPRSPVKIANNGFNKSSTGIQQLDEAEQRNRDERRAIGRHSYTSSREDDLPLSARSTTDDDGDDRKEEKAQDSKQLQPPAPTLPPRFSTIPPANSSFKADLLENENATSSLPCASTFTAPNTAAGLETSTTTYGRPSFSLDLPQNPGGENDNRVANDFAEASQQQSQPLKTANPADDPVACVNNVAQGTMGAFASAMGVGVLSPNREVEATLPLHERKVNALVRIRVLERMGKKFDRKFDMNSDPDEMHAYADAAEKVDSASRGLDTSRKILIGVVGVIEYLNSVSPVKADLDGWSSDVMANIDDYDAVLLKIWERLMASKGEMSPYWELVIMLGVSAGSYHVTQKMVKDRSKRIAEQKRREAGLLLRETQDDDGDDDNSDSESNESSSGDEDEEDDDDLATSQRRHYVTAPFIAPPSGYNPAQFVPYAAPYWANSPSYYAHVPPMPYYGASMNAVETKQQQYQQQQNNSATYGSSTPIITPTQQQQQVPPPPQAATTPLPHLHPHGTPRPQVLSSSRGESSPRQRLEAAAEAAGLHAPTPTHIAKTPSSSEEDLSEKEQQSRPQSSAKQQDFLAVVEQLAAKQALQHHSERNVDEEMDEEEEEEEDVGSSKGNATTHHVTIPSNAEGRGQGMRSKNMQGGKKHKRTQKRKQ